MAGILSGYHLSRRRLGRYKTKKALKEKSKCIERQNEMYHSIGAGIGMNKKLVTLHLLIMSYILFSPCILGTLLSHLWLEYY